MTLLATVSKIYVSRTQKCPQTLPRDSRGYLKVQPLRLHHFGGPRAARLYEYIIRLQPTQLPILQQLLCVVAIALRIRPRSSILCAKNGPRRINQRFFISLHCPRAMLRPTRKHGASFSQNLLRPHRHLAFQNNVQRDAQQRRSLRGLPLTSLKPWPSNPQMMIKHQCKVSNIHTTQRWKSYPTMSSN